MTGEGLHSKSDIAGELAHRDIEIEKSEKQGIKKCFDALLCRAVNTSDTDEAKSITSMALDMLDDAPEIRVEWHDITKLRSENILFRAALTRILTMSEFNSQNGIAEPVMKYAHINIAQISEDALEGNDES